MNIPNNAISILSAVTEIKENVLLSDYTTFRIGGKAALFAAPNTITELQDLLTLCRKEGYPTFLLGAGSNLLISDDGLDAVVISTEHLNRITIEGNTITAEAGVPLTLLCRRAAEAGLSGLEFAFGIPGSVGGGVYMNAGAYGGELKDVIDSVTFINDKKELVTYKNDQCGFTYRRSCFQCEHCVVAKASFTLTPGDSEQILATMRDIIGRRRDKQPLEYPSAGSAFKRPQGAYAGGLIEQCGLKGFSVGDAQVSEKHAGFIINKGHATCEDTCKLFNEVRRIVKEKTGYDLEPEVRLIGREW